MLIFLLNASCPFNIFLGNVHIFASLWTSAMGSFGRMLFQIYIGIGWWACFKGFVTSYFICFKLFFVLFFCMFPFSFILRKGHETITRNEFIQKRVNKTIFTKVVVNYNDQVWFACLKVLLEYLLLVVMIAELCLLLCTKIVQFFFTYIGPNSFGL